MLEGESNKRYKGEDKVIAMQRENFGAGGEEMKGAVIWDLDGTLFDSYDVIVESLWLALKENGVDMPMEQIHRHAISFSIQSLFREISVHNGVSVDELNRSYSRISTGQYLRIKQMSHAVACLSALQQLGLKSYVFTHRGRTTIPVLENLEMKHYFEEIVTSQSGFARKPDPEGLLYLMAKYNLPVDRTYYVGDRRIDMDCAANAGITGVLYVGSDAIDVSGGSEKIVIHDLLELPNVL